MSDSEAGSTAAAVEELLATLGTTDHRSAPGEAEPAPHAGDEWADLRQVLAGDPEPKVAVDDDESDEVAATPDELLAALAERVEELSSDLADERRRREELAEQLDLLAQELDGVLGEALDEERQRQGQLEATLREVQTTLAGASPPSPGDRRSGVDRRTAAERQRGLAPRPLRRRSTDAVAKPAVDDEPPVEIDADVPVDDETHEVEAEQPSIWKTRLDEVAGSVSAWTPDDVDRLRSDTK
jgi:hypothetical protein